ncbi:MAG: RluA family pseudouridine synthase [Ruminococcus sp.]|nr:RluA family pseudouridine synthase [Ruminococcus sp.]
MKEFIINKNDSGQRVDKFVTKALPELPKSMMYKLFRKKDIKINGKKCDISAVLSEGDIVRIYVKDEVSAVRTADTGFLSASDDLKIAYEDENILVAFKPVGVDSHANGETHSDTLIDRIKKYLYDKGEYNPESENSFSPALCSRLDRNTAGLVISAKNAESLREINSAIKDGKIHKIYQCITVSKPPKNSDILTAYHKIDDKRNIVRISDKYADGYKEIKTGYKILGEKNGLFLLEITLYTGRKHQIRAHLSHIGAPILGDGKYGNIALNKRYGIFYQELCACRLSFGLDENSPLAYLNKTEIKVPAFEKRFN